MLVLALAAVVMGHGDTGYMTSAVVKRRCGACLILARRWRAALQRRSNLDERRLRSPSSLEGHGKSVNIDSWGLQLAGLQLAVGLSLAIRSNSLAEQAICDLRRNHKGRWRRHRR